MFEVHLYIETDSTSPKTTQKQYGYVLECRTGAGNLCTREGFGSLYGTYHCAILWGIITAMSRLNQPCEVHIYTKDDFITGMIERNLEHWAAAGFRTAKGKPVANREEWERIWTMAQEHLLFAEPGVHAYSEWLRMELTRRKRNV